MLLSLCLCSRPSLGPAVSLAVSPTQPWDPRGVPLGTGTIVPCVGGDAVHRDQKSPPRDRRSAFLRTTGEVYNVMDVPELRRLVLGRETQVHDTQLQDTEAQDFAGRDVGW